MKLEIPPADAGAEQFRLFVESATDCAICLLDPAGRVTTWNAGTERIAGYSAAEVVGRHFSLFHPVAARAAGAPQRALDAAARDGRFQGEGWRLCKDGSRFWAEVTITALRGAAGELKGYAKVTRDMTALHLQREREQLLAATFDHAPHGIAVADDTGRYIGANPRFLQLVGYTEAELLGKRYTDLTHPDDVEPSRRVFERILAGGDEPLEFEKRFVHKDGAVVWVRNTVASIRDAEGRVVRVVGQVEDLSARRAARESERRFRLLVDGVTDYAIFMLSPQGEVVSWNVGAERIKGYSAADVIGRHFSVFFPSEDRAAGLPERALEEARRTGRHAHEGWRVRKDGTRFWAFGVIDAIRDDSGAPIGFAKITRDMTERRAAEQQVRESEARLRAFTENSPALMALKDREGRYRFANAQFLARHALRREQVIGRTDDELFPRRQAAALSAHDNEVLARAAPVHFEERWRGRDGEHVGMVSKFPLPDASGGVAGIGIVISDITERKYAEQALREQRTLLTEAQKIAGIGCWEWDPESGRLLWSDELYRIHGLAREAFTPSFEGYLERVHPEDRQNSGAMMARALMDGRGFTLQERIVRPGGEVRYLRSHGEVVRNERGKPIKVVGACLDITEQRHSDTALRQAAQDLHGLTRRLVQAEEAERRRVARELHDRVGQSLSALNINLDIILRESAALPATLRRRLEDSLALVDGTLQSIEHVMAELRPPLLDEYGLGAALAWYAEEYTRRSGIPVEVVDASPEATKSVRTEAAVALFRIAQEALNNVMKHARATSVAIEVGAADGEVELSVSDDGCGFDAAAAPRGRWGMTTMRERAQAAGGELHVDSACGKGTRVRVKVPLQ
ncbi:MAG: sensor histidine kinase [Burkholderiales bacterium]|jgi:PAS domain S-box-containing protein|nr:sensor histidine kinase [Burkholderiales bacterium]